MPGGGRRDEDARGGGRIINVSSTSVNGPAVFESIYGAAKAGLEDLSRMLSFEWARYGIRVNVVCPGLINTVNGTSLAFATPGSRDAFPRRDATGTDR